MSEIDEREELLATVATLYYKLNQNQGEIAERLGVSSSKVSRLLKEAHDRGIVEISIRVSVPRNFEMEQVLIAQFGLQDAYVLQPLHDESRDHASLLQATGQLAARYLQRIIDQLPDGSSIGAAWGTGVHAAISHLPDNPDRAIDAVQLLGGVGALVIDGPDLTRIVAAKLGGRHYSLHAPVMVERPELRDLLFEEPTVRRSLERARSVRLAITGIGTVEEEMSSFLRAGLLTRADLVRLRAEGVVGETCGHFYDIDGNSDGFAINRRIIGIDLEDLRAIPRVLAIASGLPKAPAILGALRGHLCDVLVTDDATASAVLEHARAERADVALA